MHVYTQKTQISADIVILLQEYIKICSANIYKYISIDR